MAIVINSNLVNEMDGYLTDAMYVRGGYIVVNTRSEIADIPEGNIIEGSPVYIVDEEVTLRFDGVEWREDEAGAAIQMKTLPEAGEEYVGKIRQYTGETTEELDHGYFYECLEYEDSETGDKTYKWSVVSVQPECEGGYYTNLAPVPKEIGGIAKGTTFDNMTMKEMWDMLLYPYIAFTFTASSVAAGGTFEYGTTKTITTAGATITAGTKPVNSIKIGTASGGDDLYSSDSVTSGTQYTLTSQVDLDGTTDSTIYVTLSDGTTTTTKSVTHTFKKYVYYGISNSNETPPTTLTNSKKVCGTDFGTKESDGIKLTTVEPQYVWFLTTSTAPTIMYFANGQFNEMSTNSKGTVDVTLDSGVTVTYNAFCTSKMGNATMTYKINK